MTTWLVVTAVLGLATGYVLPRPKRGPRMVNVIDGVVYPHPDDPRWAHFRQHGWLQFAGFDVRPESVTKRGRREYYNNTEPALWVDGHLVEGAESIRYARAVIKAYRQRLALEAIEKA